MPSLDYNKIYENFIHWTELNGPRVVVAAVVFVVGQAFVRILRKWLTRKFTKNDVHSSIRPFLRSLIIVIVQLLLLIVLLQILGIQLTIFAAGLASLGVTIGLALSGTLQNFASGILILLLKPFKIGDNIVAQSQDGTVTSIQIFYTVMVTKDNKTVIIPNSKLSNEVIVNVPVQGNTRAELTMKFSYSEDIEKIEKIIRDDIATFTAISPSPVPVISVRQGTPDGFSVTAQYWTDLPGAGQTQSDVHKKIVTDLKASGVKPL